MTLVVRDPWFAVRRYGVKFGRLWIVWPYFEWRDLWVGAFVKERYWELGEQHQVVYICVVPTVVLLLDWKLRTEDRHQQAGA